MNIRFNPVDPKYIKIRKVSTQMQPNESVYIIHFVTCRASAVIHHCLVMHLVMFAEECVFVGFWNLLIASISFTTFMTDFIDVIVIILLLTELLLLLHLFFLSLFLLYFPLFIFLFIPKFFSCCLRRNNNLIRT